MEHFNLKKILRFLQSLYDFKYWQYYNKGNVDGIPSEVDVNVEMIAR